MSTITYLILICINNQLNNKNQIKTKQNSFHLYFFLKIRKQNLTTMVFFFFLLEWDEIHYNILKLWIQFKSFYKNLQNGFWLKWLLFFIFYFFLIHTGSYALFYRKKNQLSGARVYKTRVQENRVSRQRVKPYFIYIYIKNKK